MFNWFKKPEPIKYTPLPMYQAEVHIFDNRTYYIIQLKLRCYNEEHARAKTQERMCTSEAFAFGDRFIYRHTLTGFKIISVKEVK